MEHGTARTKVAGDDEMLRTGFYNGTPLEAGKIADSEPVDLFAPARGVAHHHHQADASSREGRQQQQMRRPEQQEGEQEQQGEGKAVDQQVAGGGGVAAANENYAAAPGPEQGRQGMAAPTAGGRRLGRH